MAATGVPVDRRTRGAHRAADAGLHVLLGALAYWLYSLTRGVAEGAGAAAFTNARAVHELEGSLGLAVEDDLQRLAEGVPGLPGAAAWLYLNAHYVGTLAFLVWAFVAHRDRIPAIRLAFGLTLLLALVGYVLLPTAPPRLLPELGFTDTVQGLVGAGTAEAAAALYNPYAAVPSLHAGFAALVAVHGARLARGAAARAALRAYPLLVTAVIVVTANHWWLDAVAGVAVALAATRAADALVAVRHPPARTAGRGAIAG